MKGQAVGPRRNQKTAAQWGCRAGRRAWSQQSAMAAHQLDECQTERQVQRPRSPLQKPRPPPHHTTHATACYSHPPACRQQVPQESQSQGSLSLPQRYQTAGVLRAPASVSAVLKCSVLARVVRHCRLTSGVTLELYTCGAVQAGKQGTLNLQGRLVLHLVKGGLGAAQAQQVGGELLQAGPACHKAHT